MRRLIGYAVVTSLLACQQPAKKNQDQEPEPQTSVVTEDAVAPLAFLRLGRFELKEWEFFLSIQMATEMLVKQGAKAEDLEKYKDEIREKSKEATIEGFVISALLAREAERRGEKVTKEEINAERQKQFRDRKPPQNTSEADLAAVIERNLLANRVIKSLRAEVTLSDADAEAFYRDALTQIVVEYVTLSPKTTPTEEELTAFIASHQAEIKAYYEANKKDFVAPEAVKVKHILIKELPSEDKFIAAEIADGRTPEEAKKKYQSESNNRQGLIEAIAAEISAGMSFDDAAKKYSEDASSKEQGGALGWLSRGQMLKPFADAAFSIQPGQISKPVKTVMGSHLISLQEKRPEQQQELTAVERDIAFILFAQDNKPSKDAAQKIIDELTAGKKLADIAAASSLTVQRTEPFSAVQKAIPGMGSDPALVKAVQGLTIEKPSTAAPIPMGNSFIVPVLVSREAPDMAPFAVSKEQIKGAILEQRQEEKTNEWVKSAKEKERPNFEVNYKAIPNFKL